MDSIKSFSVSSIHHKWNGTWYLLQDLPSLHKNCFRTLRPRALGNKKTLGKSQKSIGKQLSTQYPLKLKEPKKRLLKLFALVLKKYTKTSFKVFWPCIDLFGSWLFFKIFCKRLCRYSVNFFKDPVVGAKQTFDADINIRVLHGILMCGSLKNKFVIFACFFSNERALSTGTNISYDILLDG